MRGFRAIALALAAGSAAALASAPAHAGGAIGWANAVTQFSTEGQAVGAAAVILGIIAIGAVLFFGLSGLVGTVIMACLGGALMANAPAGRLDLRRRRRRRVDPPRRRGAARAGRRRHDAAGRVPAAADVGLKGEGRGVRRCASSRRTARSRAGRTSSACRSATRPSSSWRCSSWRSRSSTSGAGLYVLAVGWGFGRLVTFYDPFAFEIVARNLRVPRRLRA